MRYVALLRGINVGGNNRLSMTELKLALETNGFSDVMTYINSGNIILNSGHDVAKTEQLVANSIKKCAGIDIKVLLRTEKQFRAMVNDIPITWKNDSEMKSDVMFLWDEYDSEEALELITIKDVDTVKYRNGALLWSVARDNQTKSGMIKLVGTKLYKFMTNRNVNTVRALELMLTAQE